MRHLWPVAGTNAWTLWYVGHLKYKVWTDVNDAMLALNNIDNLLL